jgi:hypothetical protein
MNKNIIETTLTLNQYKDIIKQNKGIVIFKLGAEWCNPCKYILPILKKSLPQMPLCVTTYIIDVDESHEIFSFYKRNKISSGIPVITCYYRENSTIYPDDMVIGAELDKINDFFKRTFDKAKEIMNV